MKINFRSKLYSKSLLKGSPLSYTSFDLRLKEMCIYIRYSMSIIEKVFHYEENEITVIKCRDEIWFRGKEIAKALGYEKTRNAILKHVNDDDKSLLEDLRRGPQIRATFNPIRPRGAQRPGWPNSQLPIRNLLSYDAQTW